MKSINYEESRVISELYDGENVNRIVLTRSKTSARDHYFLNSYLVDANGEEKLQGYMYFNLVDNYNRSDYIGTYINPEFRGHGVAQILNATWIDMCFANGIEDLRTIRRQRKPFLIYLLKGYDFEVKDLSYYEDKSVHICKKKDDTTKYLVFDSFSQRRLFEAGSVSHRDNYVVLDEIGDTTELDKILLNYVYRIQDKDKAYQKSRKILTK